MAIKVSEGNEVAMKAGELKHGWVTLLGPRALDHGKKGIPGPPRPVSSQLQRV